MKKAQITIFIIISIILLISLIFMINFQIQNNKNNINEVNNDNIKNHFENIKIQLESCIELVFKDSISYISLNGGYFAIENQDLIPYRNSIPYYVYGNKDISPSIISIEDETELFLENYINTCINNETLILDNYKINTAIPLINVELIENLENLELSWPISLEFQGQEITYKDFHSKLNFNFIENYNIIKEYIKLHEDDFNAIPISDLIFFSKSNNFTFEYWEIEEDSNDIVYKFNFENGLSFMFIIQYTWS